MRRWRRLHVNLACQPDLEGASRKLLEAPNSNIILHENIQLIKQKNGSLLLLTNSLECSQSTLCSGIKIWDRFRGLTFLVQHKCLIIKQPTKERERELGNSLS